MTKSVKFKRKKNTAKAAAEDPKKAAEINRPSFIAKRFNITIFCILLMAAALLAQTAYIQLIDSDRLIKEANYRSLRTHEIPFTRGRILDRDGNILAVSVPMYGIEISPREYFDTKLKRSAKSWKALALETGSSKRDIEKAVSQFLTKKNVSKEKVVFDPRAILNTQAPDYWKLLAEVTGLDYNLLISNVRNNPDSEFVRLDNEQARLEKEKWQKLAESINKPYKEIMAKMYKFERQQSLILSRKEPENIATYIKKDLRIEGVVIKSEFRRFYPLKEETAQLIGFTDVDDKHGAEGLERSFDSLLIGKAGKQIVRKDKRGNVIENIHDEKQYDPQDIKLSIDEDLQSTVYKEIEQAVIANEAESGTAVLVDITTGEVLAMVNAPSFNPNNRAEFKPALMRNRVITDTFEPGSTVKPLVVLTALQNGATYRDEIINTRPFTVNGHTIKDVSPRESLSLTGILQKSSNVGVSRLALRMPSTALVDTYSKVGFGKDTGLGLGEQRGTNGDRKRWADIERATMAYGYGLNVTPLQLARAYATLGSFGVYRPLSITKVDPPVLGDRVLPEKITRDVVKMMESVAQKGEGGQRAMVDGYRVAVKTGTARKLEKGQYVKKYLAYTAGIAPASNPRFALVVLLNEPKAGNYYGGAVSAPLFSSIMGYALKAYNIKPDNLSETH